VFGITENKETKAGEWAEVPPLPEADSKIIHCTCDTNGTYFIVVCENETIYFSGTNKKGESGEARKNCIFVNSCIQHVNHGNFGGTILCSASFVIGTKTGLL